MGALDEQRWLDVRRFRALHEAGASVSEIARETGLNWRTVKKYLTADGANLTPPKRRGRPARGQVIDTFAHVVDAWLRAELLLKGTVIHERLVDQYGFTGNYQRVKIYLQQARPRVAAELGISPDQLAGLHRRFEVIPGAQAQVDWGDEGGILAHVGIAKVYSFHMVLSYSRDPFCCFATSQDLAAFWGAHRLAFQHFGGVPGSIVYGRTKTVVRRHVAPGQAVPLHPEAVAFAGHYDFDIDVLAAYRPTGKGRVERQVTIVRDHVLAGRAFSSLEEIDAAFLAWVPQRRALRHRRGVETPLRTAQPSAAGSVTLIGMEQQHRALPKSDLETIFGIVVTVHGHLLADQLPHDLVGRLLNRLTEYGPLPEGATAGEMNALLADLCQRLHWAMSDDYGDYPEPMARRTTYYLDIPDETADACAAVLTGMGGDVIIHSDEHQTTSGHKHIGAAFPNLPPDPDHHARVAELSTLAQHHGGEFAGFGA